MSFDYTNEGRWRLSAELPADEGAVWERALTEMREELFRAGEAGPGPSASPADVSWADAFVAIAEKSLAAVSVERPHRDRHMVLLHVRDARGHLHLGPGLSEGLRRYISCDSRVRAVLESEGRPVNVGRALHTVPDRTRIVVEDRDRGCRVPGCDRGRWQHRHAQPHLALPASPSPPPSRPPGHRGHADERDGVTFTDDRGRRLEACGRPAPPGDEPPPPGNWVPPSGERLDPWPIYFNEPVALKI